MAYVGVYALWRFLGAEAVLFQRLLVAGVSIPLDYFMS